MERNIPTPQQRLSVVAASERILTHLAAAEEDEAAEVTLALVDIEEECNGGLMGEARMQLRRPLPPKLLALTCALLHVQAHPHLTPSPAHRPIRSRNSLRCALHPSCLRTRRHPNVWRCRPLSLSMLLVGLAHVDAVARRTALWRRRRRPTLLRWRTGARAGAKTRRRWWQQWSGWRRE